MVESEELARDDSSRRSVRRPGQIVRAGQGHTTLAHPTLAAMARVDAVHVRTIASRSSVEEDMFAAGACLPPQCVLRTRDTCGDQEKRGRAPIPSLYSQGILGKAKPPLHQSPRNVT